MSGADFGNLNEMFPFSLWKAPGFGYIPLIEHRNKPDEHKIYPENELSWSNLSVGGGHMETLMQHIRDCKANIKTCYETAKASIDQILNEDNKPFVPLMPKTPGTVKKTRTRVGRISKRTSIAQQSVRRSTRRGKASLLNSDRRMTEQISDVLLSLCKDAPKQRGTKKKTTVEEQRSTDNISNSPEHLSSHATQAGQSSEENQENEQPHSPKVKDLINYHEHVITEVKEAVEKQYHHENGYEDRPVVASNAAATVDVPLADDQSSIPEEVSPESELKSTTPTKGRKKGRSSKVQKAAIGKLSMNSKKSISKHSTRNADQSQHLSKTLSSKAVVDVSSISEEMDTSHEQETSAWDSSQVCSSSAATLDLSQELRDMGNKELRVSIEKIDLVLSGSDEDDEFKDDTRKEQPQRQSTRLKSLRSSTQSSVKVLGGLAAKRLSTRKSLRLKTILTDQHIQNEVSNHTSKNNSDAKHSEYETETDEAVSENKDDENEATKVKKRARIAKPVKKSKTKLGVNRSGGYLKRNSSKANMDNASASACSSPSEKRRRNMPRVVSFLNRSTAASRARTTPNRASPLRSRIVSPLLHTPSSSNINIAFKSFLTRNTPERPNRDERAEMEEKKRLLEEKRQKEEEVQRRLEEEKLQKLAEAKKKREERAQRAIQIREMREKAEKERRDEIQDRWEQRIADADRNKNKRKIEENAKMQKQMEKLAKAEAKRKEDEDEKLKRLKEQEEERERRVKQHLAEKKLAEEQRSKEKRMEEEQKRAEEERLKEAKLEQERLRIAAEEEKVQKKREELEKLKKLQEQEAAARNKKQQEKLQKLKEERERARIERERIKKQKQEEKRLAKEEEMRVRQERKRAKEREMRQREEELRQQEEEEELARAQEAARLREQEETRRLQEQEAIQKVSYLAPRSLTNTTASQAKEVERQKRMEAARKREELRKKVEAERKLREEKLKQEKAKEKKNHLDYMQKVKEAEERIKKLQQQNELASSNQLTAPSTPNYAKSAHNATYTKDESMDNYNMTPRGPGRPLQPSTSEDYNIADMMSDDSTDNEDEPKKVVPKWAKGAQFQSAIVHQHRFPPNLDLVFPNLLNPVDLEQVFNRRKERYYQRTSSAHWSSPVMPHGHISFTKY